MLNTKLIKEKAKSLGFASVGIAPAHKLEEAEERFGAALEEGRNADLHFLERDVDKRFDPEELLPDCKSVLVVALDYRINDKPASTRYRTARYTWVEDYHVLVKQMLAQVVEAIQQQEPNAHCRITVDSSCISEKNWAIEAGVGCIGKNSLIHNENGSFFVLGTILTDCAFDAYDSPKMSDCGNCTLCIDSCPAHALTPYKLDARKCYSYHTVENKNPDIQVLTDSPFVFGCDICQEVCPKNKKNIQNHPSVLKSSLFLRLQNEEMENLTQEDFKTNFGDTAIARRKLERFSRAIKAKKTGSSRKES